MDLLRYWAVFILVAAITSTLGVSDKTITCPLDESSNRQTCSETCFPANRSGLVEKEDGNIFTKQLDSYIGQCQIMFVEDNCGKLTWNYSKAVEEARHMMITVYVQMDNTTMQPLPGCCEVPLSDKSCTSKLHPLPMDVYFGLSLFGARSFGWVQEDIRSFCKDDVFTTTTTMTSTVKNPFWKYSPKVPSINNVDSIRVPSRFAPSRNHFMEPTFSGSDIGSDIIAISRHPESTPDSLPFDPVVGRTGYLDPPPLQITFQKYDGPRIIEQVRSLDAMKYNYVCVFQESKAVVMKDREEVSPYNIDSALFNRGVFEMPGYHYKRNTLYHESTFMQPVNCTSRSFRNSSVYNMSSPNPDNSTFTCLVLWATMNASDSVQVKCMPHNATYLESEETPEITREDFHTAMIIIIVCSVGSTCILGVIITLMWRCKRRYDKMIKDTRELPGGLGKMMDEDFDTLASRRSSLSSKEVVDVYEYHQVKKDRNDCFTNAKISEPRLKNSIDDPRAYLNPAYDGERFGKSRQNTSFDSGVGSSSSSAGSSGAQSQTSDASLHKQHTLPASLQDQRRNDLLGGDSGDSGVCVDDCDLPYLERNGLPVSPFFAINFAKHSRSPSNTKAETKVSVEAETEKAKPPGNYVKRAAHKPGKVTQNTEVPNDKVPIRGISMIEIPPKLDPQAVISPDSGIQSGPVFFYPPSAKDSRKTPVESEEEPSPRLKAFSFADSGLPGSPPNLCTADDSSDGDEPLNRRGCDCLHCSAEVIKHTTVPERFGSLKHENEALPHLDDESECDGYKPKDWPMLKEQSRVDFPESLERCDFDLPLDDAVAEGEYKTKDWPNMRCEEYRENKPGENFLTEKCLDDTPRETVNEATKREFGETHRFNQERQEQTSKTENTTCDGYVPKTWYGKCQNSLETSDDGINQSESGAELPDNADCASAGPRDLAECQTYLDKFSLLNDFERSAIEAHYLDKQALAPVPVLGRCGVDQTSNERFVKPEIA